MKSGGYVPPGFLERGVRVPTIPPGGDATAIYVSPPASSAVGGPVGGVARIATCLVQERREPCSGASSKGGTTNTRSTSLACLRLDLRSVPEFSIDSTEVRDYQTRDDDCGFHSH